MTSNTNLNTFYHEVNESLHKKDLDSAFDGIGKWEKADENLFENFRNRIESVKIRYKNLVNFRDKFKEEENIEIVDRLSRELIKLFDEINQSSLSIKLKKYPKPLKIFLSYSHIDKDWKNQLEAQFRPLIDRDEIQIWHDGKILPGTNWDETIKEKLFESDIIMFLVSAELINSNYVRNHELPLAENLHDLKKAVIIPIYVRHIDTEGNVLGQIQGYPNADYEFAFLIEYPIPVICLHRIVQDLKKQIKTIKESKAA